LSNAAAAAAAAAAADDDDDADADYIRADQSSSSENDYSRCSTFLFLTFHKIFPISKIIYFFLFSVQTTNISSSISPDVKSRYTNTFYSTVHQSPPQKKLF